MRFLSRSVSINARNATAVKLFVAFLFPATAMRWNLRHGPRSAEIFEPALADVAFEQVILGFPPDEQGGRTGGYADHGRRGATRL